MAAPQHVLVVGGGPAALEGVLALQRMAGASVDITLVADQDAFFYRPASVAEPFGLSGSLRYSLDAIAADRGFARRRGKLLAVDAPARVVRLEGGETLAYDALLLALGAGAADAVPGALRFGGPRDVERLRAALAQLPDDRPARVASIAAPGTEWTVPAYELALLTAHWAQERPARVEAWVVTHEERALGVFGDRASRSVGELLEAAGVALWTGAHARAVENGRLLLGDEGGLGVDLAVALPAVVARRIDGLPADAAGFVPVDELGRVRGLDGVYAAGDMTARPLKQGGLATQQADAAASAIAAAAGAPVTPEPYRPVLRGLMATGTGARHLRRDEPVERGPGALWPLEKIVARELGPFLAEHPEFAQATP